MGCGCGKKPATSSVVASRPPEVNNTQMATQTAAPQEPAVCAITLDILNKWQNILMCVKNNNSYQKVGISEIVLNQFLGIIQSAKNYPADYCYYGDNLENFKVAVLPKIIENEPNCL